MNEKSRSEKLPVMVENYINRVSQRGSEDLLKFHHRHLLSFINRCVQMVSLYRTPSSALFYHDVFLVLEAATTVLKKDLRDITDSESPIYFSLHEYINTYDLMRSGELSLSEGPTQCLMALRGGS